MMDIYNDLRSQSILSYFLLLQPNILRLHDCSDMILAGTWYYYDLCGISHAVYILTIPFSLYSTKGHLFFIKNINLDNQMLLVDNEGKNKNNKVIFTATNTNNSFMGDQLTLHFLKLFRNLPKLTDRSFDFIQ